MNTSIILNIKNEILSPNYFEAYIVLMFTIIIGIGHKIIYNCIKNIYHKILISIFRKISKINYKIILILKYREYNKKVLSEFETINKKFDNKLELIDNNEIYLELKFNKIRFTEIIKEFKIIETKLENISNIQFHEISVKFNKQHNKLKKEYKNHKITEKIYFNKNKITILTQKLSNMPKLISKVL